MFIFNWMDGVTKAINVAQAVYLLVKSSMDFPSSPEDDKKERTCIIFS